MPKATWGDEVLGSWDGESHYFDGKKIRTLDLRINVLWQVSVSGITFGVWAKAGDEGVHAKRIVLKYLAENGECCHPQAFIAREFTTEELEAEITDKEGTSKLHASLPWPRCEIAFCSEWD